MPGDRIFSTGAAAAADRGDKLAGQAVDRAVLRPVWSGPTSLVLRVDPRPRLVLLRDETGRVRACLPGE